jgi:hypothetical protein
MAYVFKVPTAPIPAEKMIDSDECSTRLGLHKVTLVNKTRAGLIPCYRIPTEGEGDGEYRFLWSEVTAALRLNVNGGSRESTPNQ